ncbi:zinc finger CCHC domain-containing protein 7 [Esox lucius]|uniref:Zinc finger CCHC domain-containing protein 7 n=1 Tax=Esox lucius TaxID=8010 RepID=A0A3P8ZCK4_ESOLU|nr:zinc finger CCHC domain-containing protein 7 [Esox lucius]
MTGHQTDEEEGGVRQDIRFYIEASSDSECELGSRQHLQADVTSPPQGAARATRGCSPPVLAFTLPNRASSDASSLDGTPSPTSRSGLRSPLDQAQEYDDEPPEEWMFLGGEEKDGDRDIQLNLGCWISSSSELHSGTEDEEPNAKSAVKDNWAIIDKDKPRPYRCMTSDIGLTCHNCNKTGHLAKSCTSPRRRPSCVLCGLQGHVQRGCPGRHCPSCGLPSHGHQSCSAPPLWNQHCQRCGMTGHLSTACPDAWRQFHLTTQEEVPLRPDRDHTYKRHRRPAHCYNCSGKGHHGHECPQRRMISGTFPTVPYICHYNNKQDILKQKTRIHREPQEGVKLVVECQRTSVTPGGSGKEEPSTVPGRRKSQGGRREGRRKKWPEKRRERREVKKQRREAQARREVVVTTRVSGEKVHPSDRFYKPPQRTHTSFSKEEMQQ